MNLEFLMIGMSRASVLIVYKWTVSLQVLSGFLRSRNAAYLSFCLDVVRLCNYGQCVFIWAYPLVWTSGQLPPSYS